MEVPINSRNCAQNLLLQQQRFERVVLEHSTLALAEKVGEILGLARDQTHRVTTTTHAPEENKQSTQS